MGIFNKKFAIMINIVLFGKPGAGKGTQAAFLKSQYDLVHISTGDLFRFNIKNKTELGILAKSYLDKGDLVPDRVTINMLENEVDKNLDAKGFIFDGFPRTTAQAEALDTLLADLNTAISGMLSLQVDDEELTKRLLLRGKDSGRADDQDESIIRNRIKEYNNKTLPLKEFYGAQNKLQEIEGIGTVEEINQKLCITIDNL